MPGELAAYAYLVKNFFDKLRLPPYVRLARTELQAWQIRQEDRPCSGRNEQREGNAAAVSLHRPQGFPE